MYASRRVIPCVVVLAVALAGCAGPGEPPTIDRIKPILKLAVSLGTDRLLTQNPKAVPIVLDTIQLLNTLFAGTEFTTPASMRAVIQAKLDAQKFAPDVRLVIDALMESVAAELSIQIRRLDIPDTQAVMLIKEVLGWVYEVALRHSQAPPTVKKLS